MLVAIRVNTVSGTIDRWNEDTGLPEGDDWYFDDSGEEVIFVHTDEAASRANAVMDVGELLDDWDEYNGT